MPDHLKWSIQIIDIPVQLLHAAFNDEKPVARL
jgi:hypothetical protein